MAYIISDKTISSWFQTAAEAEFLILAIIPMISIAQQRDQTSSEKGSFVSVGELSVWLKCI